jgi:hypothetical protein
LALALFTWTSVLTSLSDPMLNTPPPLAPPPKPVALPSAFASLRVITSLLSVTVAWSLRRPPPFAWICGGGGVVLPWVIVTPLIVIWLPAPLL